MHSTRFEIAGVVFEVTSNDADGIQGISEFYDFYRIDHSRPPDVIVRTSVEAGFRGRDAEAPSPAFDTREQSDGSIAFWRDDAEGRLWVPADPAEPVVGEFVAAENWGTEAAVRICAAAALPRLSGFILHSSAVSIGGKAYVFSGQSGAGKSTIADLLVGPDKPHRKLADELLLVRRDDRRRWVAHVAPFHGMQGLPHGHTAQVAAVHFLAHAQHHETIPLPEQDSVAGLLSNTVVYASNRATANAILDTVAEFVEDVPCFRLNFARDPSVLDVLPIT